MAFLFEELKESSEEKIDNENIISWFCCLSVQSSLPSLGVSFQGKRWLFRSVKAAASQMQPTERPSVKKGGRRRLKELLQGFQLCPRRQSGWIDGPQLSVATRMNVDEELATHPLSL